MSSNKDNKFKIWLKATRAPFLTATIVPVLLGTILAWYDTDIFSGMKLFLVVIGVSCIHIATNLTNDYFDHTSGNDEANETPTPFSGGSRVIQDGLIKPKGILYFSLACFVLGSGIGLYLNFLCEGNVVLILGLIGVFLGFFYTATPVRIGYLSFGEIAVGIGFGPLVILGSYYVQSGHILSKVFWISIPVAILVALILLINEFPDYAADKSAGKNTLVVILGKRKAVFLYKILLIMVYVSIVSLIIFGLLPYACLIVFFTIPLALKALKTLEINFDKIHELLPANAATIGFHFLIGVLLSVGLTLDKIL